MYYVGNEKTNLLPRSQSFFSEVLAQVSCKPLEENSVEKCAVSTPMGCHSCPYRGTKSWCNRYSQYSQQEL